MPAQRLLSQLRTGVRWWLVLLLLVVGFAASALNTYRTVDAEVQDRLGQSLSSGLNEMQTVLERSFYDLDRTTQFLADLPPIDGLRRVQAHGSTDPLDGETREVWLRRLTDIYFSYAQQLPSVAQVRFIGADGLEWAQVERIPGQAGVEITPRLGMQYKGETDYFKATLASAPGNALLSEISLNREHGGVIEANTFPTVRSSTLVVGSAGQPLGVVVVNLNVQTLLHDLQETDRENNQDLQHTQGLSVKTYLTNERGQYLLHPQLGAAFAHEYGRDIHWNAEFAELPAEGFWSLIQHAHRRVRDAATGEVYALATREVSIGTGENAPKLYIKKLVSETEMAAAVRAQVWPRLLLGVLTLVAGVSVLVLFRLNRKLHRKDAELQTAFANQAAALRAFQAFHETVNQHALVSETDAAGRITAVNEAFMAISGYSREELLGQNHRIVNSGYHPREFWKEMWALATLGQSWRANVCNRAKNGHLYWVDTMITPFLDSAGKLERLISIRVDITERVANEQALIKARIEAEKASLAKGQFLANMSHEIRTPLNAVIGLLQIIHAGASDAQQRGQIVKAQTAAKSLLALLNDILDFSKIESGKLTLDPNPFDFHGLMNDLRVILEGYGNNDRLKLVVASDAHIPNVLVGDTTRLKQILINLGGNAIKFTPAGSVSVTATLLTATPADAFVRFSVCDTGIGIAPENQARIFDDFSQADASTTRRFGGTGLGLGISRRLIKLMGGELNVRSELGHGSEFSFDLQLPISSAEKLKQLAASAPAHSSHSLAGMSVLLVDDVAINREVAESLLSMEGARVTSAENGQLAIDVLACGHPLVDVVLMDMQMPVMDGLQATRVIRQRLGLTDVPIIAMTANASTEDRQACLDAGMNDHMAKPFDLPVLVNMLKQWVPSAALQDDTPPEPFDTPATEPPHQPWPATFNAQGALARLGHDTRLYEKLLKGLTKHLQTQCSQMAQALEDQDVQALAQGAHGIKGMALNLGAEELSQTAAQLEQTLKHLLTKTDRPAVSGPELVTLTGPLREAVDHTQAALQDWAAEPDDPLPPALEPKASNANLQEALQHLQGLLANADMEAMDGYDQLLPALKQAFGPDLDALDQAMENLDFEAAEQAVTALLKLQP